MVHGHVFEIKEADYQTTCCCCFKTRVARGGGGGLGPALLIVYQPQTKGQGNGSRTCV